MIRIANALEQKDAYAGVFELGKRPPYQIYLLLKFSRKKPLMFATRIRQILFGIRHRYFRERSGRKQVVKNSERLAKAKQIIAVKRVFILEKFAKRRASWDIQFAY